jgi:hypothetical protein
VDEVRLHTGTRVRLTPLEVGDLPADFAAHLRAFASADDRIEAVFGFRLQADDRDPQPSLAIAIRSAWLGRADDAFIAVVERLQHHLPDDASLNLYRFGASELLARYCTERTEPLFLRSPSWLERQRRKYA